MLYAIQIKTCRTCGAEITLVQSNAGKWYPADVDRSSGKPEIAYSNEGGILRGKQKSATYPKLHRCAPTRTSIEVTINNLREQLMAEEAALENGEWGIDTRVTELAIEAWEYKLATL